MKMKFFQLFLIIIILIGCSQQGSDVHEWIRSHNENTLRGATLSTQERGNKSNDVRLVESMSAYQKKTSELITKLSNSSKEQIINDVKLHLDTIDVNEDIIKKYFNISKSSALSEIKIQLALVEKETFSSYTKNIGLQEVMFDKIDIYFLPDEVLVEQNKNVSGRLVFAATAAYLGEDVKMILNGKELEMSDGGGIVNIPYNEISKDFLLDAKFDFASFGLDYSKKIALKPTN